MKYIIRREHITIMKDGEVISRRTLPEVYFVTDDIDDIEKFRKGRAEGLKALGVEECRINFEYDTVEDD